MRKPAESDAWAPSGFRSNYYNLAKDPAIPGVLVDLLVLIGYSATVEQIESWPLRARVEVEAYAVNVHVCASDNGLRRHPMPGWFPDPWGGPGGSETALPTTPNWLSVEPSKSCGCDESKSLATELAKVTRERDYLIKFADPKEVRAMQLELAAEGE